MLAVENLRIRYSPTARTASFDVDRRLLTLPIFAKLSPVLYEMLAAHEVAHALHTPKIDRIAAAKKLLSLAGWPVDADPANIIRAASYVNICEDVRIEKLIKLIYPGLRVVFTKGYEETLKMDFFGDLSDIGKKSLISRVNLHYKVGAFIHVPFATEEFPYVKAIGETQTWDEMMVACRALYEFARNSKDEEYPELEPESGEQEESSMVAVAVPVPQDESPEEPETQDIPDAPEALEGPPNDPQESEEPAEENQTEAPGSEEESEPGDGEAEPDSGSGEADDMGDDEEDGVEQEETESSDGDGALEESSRPLDDDTQNNFDDHLQSHLDPKSEFKYASLPHVVTNRATRDYRVIMAQFREAIAKSKVDLSGKEEWFHGILRKLEPDVIFLVQQFLMRRRADETKRTRTTTLGDLDMNKLWQYRFQDDIFATTEIVESGKNHGLVLVVDWSGSMASAMFDVLIQLLVLMLFCRRAQIPFEVYAFLTADHTEGGSFIPTVESVAMDTNTRIYNIFSSRMSKPEFMSMCYMMFGSFNSKREFRPVLATLNNVYGTPLGEAMLIASEVSEGFRRKYNLQFVHTVFLTDGDGNSPMTVRVNLLEDPKTRRSYAPKDENPTISVLDLMPLIVRHRTGSNMIGFYVGTPTEKMLTDANMTREEANRQLQENGSILIKSTNYNLFLVLNPSMVLPENADPGETLSRRLKAKVFLQEFIKLVA